MSFRRVGGLAAIAVATVICISCGDVYRPVVLPVNPTPPNPANFHAVFGISSNAQFNPGTVLQIDVSGDTNIGTANMGENPTHIATLPNNSRIFVTSAGSLNTGDNDIVTAFTPASDSTIATGLGTPTIFSFPNLGPGQLSGITAISEAGNLVTVTLSTPLSQAQVNGQVTISNVITSGANNGGYNGNFTITAVNGTTLQYIDSITGLAPASGGEAVIPVPLFCRYLPDFVTTTQTTTVFVANYGEENGPSCNYSSTDSVASLSVATNSISNIAYLTPGAHPVALAETPDALNLYVVNQGNNTVMDLSPVDLTTLATISVPGTPVWAVARTDNQRLYVLAQGAGTLVPIDVATNTILPSQTNLSVGAGANFILYDKTLNRIYVTNPATGTVYVYSATGGLDPSGTPNDTPSLLSTIVMTAGSNPPCAEACSPVSVTALPDGSRFYVASYSSEPNCTDPNVGTTSPCIVPRLTVFNALSMTPKTPSSTLLAPAPSLSLLTPPQYAPTQYAVPPVPACAPTATYTPGSTRFRMFTASAADSTHVYVSICDAGSIADINTTTSSISTGGSNTPDTLITNIIAPFGSCSGANCSSIATITSFSIASGVATFQAVNNFVPGNRVAISGLTSSAGVTYLNGLTVTVSATGLTGTSFQAVVSAPDTSATTDTGTAVPISPPQSPIFLLTGT
ncbi:MAG TPA: hypothetical protein VJQ59_00050 [Candidatus Sulfotelmatobacter sp.]|nr:hypothetical protein [Candidatus Sulfotelmatobacter sp.]